MKKVMIFDDDFEPWTILLLSNICYKKDKIDV